MRSWHMYPFQIWVRDDFHEDFREDSKVYLIEPQFCLVYPRLTPLLPLELPPSSL